MKKYITAMLVLCCGVWAKPWSVGGSAYLTQDIDGEITSWVRHNLAPEASVRAQLSIEKQLNFLYTTLWTDGIYHIDSQWYAYGGLAADYRIKPLSGSQLTLGWRTGLGGEWSLSPEIAIASELEWSTTDMATPAKSRIRAYLVWSP